MNLKIIGEHDQRTIEQAKRVLEHGADRFVLCADGHLGYGHPIGGVALYKDRISLSGVGFDIACGNMAVKLPVKLTQIENKLSDIGDQISQQISFGVGRKNKVRVEAEFLDTHENWLNEGLAGLKDLAASQLGTVGSGNHYVDVFVDSDDFIWIGVHFGSRGLGHKATTHFLKKLGAKDGMDSTPCIVDLSSDVGQNYFEAMTLAGKYAYAGREWVCSTVAKIIQGNDDYLEVVHNHHNYSFLETWNGEQYHVVRKGATPCAPGQSCFVGGSMGDYSVILEGLDTPAARENFFSTVHGAGRVMSRTKAAGKQKWVDGKKITIAPGVVDENLMRASVKNYGVLLYGAGADEAPECYRKLKDVLAYHADSVRVRHWLKPLIVCMAGAGEFDPYKD